MLETYDSATKTLTLRSNHASKDFLAKMAALRSAGLFTDISLRAEGNEDSLRAHKLVLCCCSPYFEAMFRGNFEESNQQEGIVIISQVTPDSLFQIINYFYTGFLKVTHENVVELLNAADIFLLNNAKENILKFLRQTMNASNCLEFRSLAQLYSDAKLEEAANLFIARNFEAVSKSDDFLATVTIEEFEEVLKQEIAAKDEDVIVQAIFLWISRDFAVRIELFERLSRLVKWSEVSETLKSDIQQKYLQLPSMQLQTSADVKRKRSSRLLIAIGYDSQDVECLDLNDMKNGWKILTKLPMRYGLSGASLTSCEDKLIITGGVGSGGILKAVRNVYVYSFKTNEWNEGPMMKSARKCHGSSFLNNALYAVGGTDAQMTVLTAEILVIGSLSLRPLRKKCEEEPSNDASDWKEEPNQLISWHNGSSGLVNIADDKLAAISVYGTDQDKLFDLEAREWSKLRGTNERISRDHPGVGIYNGEIVVAGGVNANSNFVDSVESFDIGVNQWKLWPSKLAIPRAGPGVIQIDRFLYVVGGRGQEVNGSVEIFDPETNNWAIHQDISVHHPDQEYAVTLLDFV